MRYVILLSDGDASVYPHLVKLDPYPGIKITKEECVNHVGKRLSSALKDVVAKSAKGQKMGGKKEGSLTGEKILKLQNYYTSAIRKNAPSVSKMQSAILASPRHCMSTNASPMHGLCPTGEKSWCFYNRAMAKGEKPPDHKINTSTALRPEFSTKLMPIYNRLSTEDLLSRCVRVGTQNSNESLHHSIWSRCPKAKGTTKKKIEVCQNIV